MQDQNTVTPNDESSPYTATPNEANQPPKNKKFSFRAWNMQHNKASVLIIAVLVGLAGIVTLQLSHADSSSIKKLTPVKDASLTASQPQFKWDSLATFASYQIQIDSKSSTGTFSPVVDTVVSTTLFTPVKPLAAGDYTWRVRGNQPRTTWSPSWHFSTTAQDGSTGGTGGGGGSGAGTITPTAGAINVRSAAYGALGNGTGDDTAAFKKAIAAAIGASAVKYLSGPGGQPQGVVYVPAGTYRILELPFSSNIRMEVDANAVLEQAGGVKVGANSTTLIRWDGSVGSPLKNVSLVGVGSGNPAIKAKANPIASGRSIANSFTFNVDAADTTSSNKMSGLIIQNTQGFLVENVFSIENDHLPDLSTVTTANVKDYYPTSQKAVLVMRARSDSPCSGPFAQPVNGTIANWYNIHGPKGYGPNQVGAGQNIVFSHIFSQGGTTLRLETDSSQPSASGTTCPNGKTKFGSEIRGLTATDIEGLNCNRVVAFTPHLQDNYDVKVSNVLSTDCSEGVIESKSTLFHKDGSFNNSTLSNVKVVGSGSQPSQQLAQNGTSGAIVGYWSIGKARQAFTRDAGLNWWVTYGNPISCQGSFQQLPATIHTATGTLKPVCTP